MSDKYKIMIVAGEASGDAHGARLVRAIREAAPDREFEFFGAAGQAMRDAGVEPVVAADHLAVVGIPEIARAMRTFLKAFRDLKKAASERAPDAVVLIDFPDFNLKLARSLKRNGLRVIYYISPQLWAWRKYRKNIVRDHVDLLLTVLPFEKDWYARHGIENVEYVGNPLANEVRSSNSREEFRRKHDLRLDAPLIALLPGSRHKELSRILPPMLEAAAIMSRAELNLQFAIALASTRSENEVNAAIHQAEDRGILLPPGLRIVRGETYDALNAADAAAVTSGTATLETGIIGTPMAIVYKTSALNYKLLRPLIKVDHFGLINLIAGKRIAAELIQDDFTPETLAAELRHLIDPAANARVRCDLREAAEKLGQGGASRRAAVAILAVLDD
jgi:lipid-A-disaccharide synthase